MASFLHYHSLLVLLLLTLLPLISLIPTSAAHRHHHHDKLKSLHFTLYHHETINKTAYIIVNGVAGAGFSLTTSPFGTLYAVQDPLTLKREMTSKVVGSAQGTSIISSLDGLEGISTAKLTLDVKGYKGSVSLVGVTHNTKPSDHPVVGGTGDFLFVQGYVTYSPMDLVGITVTYKAEFHLYWPPYATPKSLSMK